MNRIIILCFMLGVVSAHARDVSGQWAQKSPEVRSWMKQQKVPGTDVLCCDESDGDEAEEDIRAGHYWTRWRIGPNTTPWVPVPDEALIREPNPNGAAVVWWMYESGLPKIRCFVPGGGV